MKKILSLITFILLLPSIALAEVEPSRSSYWYSCGTATAVTSDVAIRATGGTLVRIYVTDIGCKNTSTTVSTALDFKEGTTVFHAGGIGAQVALSGTNGSYSHSFPLPRRLSANTALNFATNTATTSVTCCAGGFVAIN